MTRVRARQAESAVVYGASGFVGQAVHAQLSSHGVAVRVASAPRLRCARTDLAGVLHVIDQVSVERVREEIAGVDAVVNATGVTPGADADLEAMMGANALFAAILAAAVGESGARLVHLSSSAVQGGAAVLTASGPLMPYNTYSRSKALGEQVVQLLCPTATCLRPGSVHGFDRPMTRRIVTFAHSRAAFTLAPGTAPTPQMHILNVAAAVSHLATTTANPPIVVLQPDEAFTTVEFLELMGGGRSPHLLPRPLGRAASWARTACSRITPRLAQQLRRLELLMKGQGQEVSWLMSDGFQLPCSHEHWRDMVQRIQRAARP